MMVDAVNHARCFGWKMTFAYVSSAIYGFSKKNTRYALMNVLLDGHLMEKSARCQYRNR